GCQSQHPRGHPPRPPLKNPSVWREPPRFSRIRGGSRHTAGCQARLASRVISMPARACETGQPVLAPSAISWNFSGVMPGTVALTLRWLPVMPVPGLNVTDAEVFTRSGGVPFSLSACDRAMLKHEACAAAMSSSGVVVVSDPSLRAFQSMGKVPRFDDEKATLPEPSVRDPVQVVAASLVTDMFPPGIGVRRRGIASCRKPTQAADDPVPVVRPGVCHARAHLPAAAAGTAGIRGRSRTRR